MSGSFHVPFGTPSSTTPMPDAEKRETVIAVHAISPPGTSSSEAASEQTQWQSGIRKRFPWVGFGAILVVLNCTMATLLVLKFSNDKAASIFCKGHIEPNVFLSIFNSIANIAITVAVANGIAIAWWRRARAGQTMKELHYSWSFSMSFFAILTKIRYFNIIALAALATKVAVIDSVLYQRSLGTYIATVDELSIDKNYFTFASQVFPFTAAMGPTPGSVGTLMSEFYYNVYYWMQNPLVSTTLNAISECNAFQCQFALPAAGLSMDCIDTWRVVDYNTSAPQAFASNQSSGYKDLPLFSTSWSFTGSSSNTSSSNILLQMTYASPFYDESDVGSGEGESCRTNLTTSICVFRPAVLNYTVVITNQESETKSDLSHSNDKETQHKNKHQGSQFDVAQYGTSASLSLGCNSTYDQDNPESEWCGSYNTSWHQIAGVKMMRNIDVAEPVAPFANSTLYGFYLAFKDYFTASATLDFDGKNWSIIESGQFAFASGDNTFSPGYGPYVPAEGSCANYYYDTRTALLQQINMLTLSIATDPYSYYNRNDDSYGPDSNNTIVRTLYWTDSSNYTKTVKKHNFTAQQIFAAYYDVDHPLPGFDPSEATPQTTTVYQQYKDVFYLTDWNYTYGAIAATAIVICCIIPVYWRFWELGRKVTLGPFEIAYAFQSPAFSGVHDAAGEADVVLKHVGRNKVKYVEVTDETGRKYAFQPIQA